MAAAHGRLARAIAVTLATTVILVGLPGQAEAAATQHIVISDASLVEGNSGSANMSFVVSYSGPPVTLSVRYATSNGTATSGSDYTARTGTLTITTSKSATLTVPVLGDAVDENDETFNVTLSNPSDGQIDDAVGIGTILDNDAAPTMTAGNVSKTEGNSGATNVTFNVGLSAASSFTVTADYATIAASASPGDDYTSTTGVLTFAPGETAKTVNVPVLGDAIDEDDETFSLALSNISNATLGTNGTGTIADDDGPPALSIADVAVTEGDAGLNDANFVVSLDAASGRTISVDWTTFGATATSGEDFLAGNGTVTFNAGQTSKTVTVAVTGDVTDEDNETLTVGLAGPINATISDAYGQATIQDDDDVPAMSTGDETVVEGDAGSTTASFTVTLDAPSSRTITASWATDAGTAAEGPDYVGGNGTITFAPGQTTKTIEVAVAGDLTYELDESFTVVLSNPSNATIGDGSGSGTIQNDDAKPSLSVDDVSIAEGQAGDKALIFTVTLVGASEVAASVDYATVAGSAAAPSDYLPASGTLTFNPGQTTKPIAVTVYGDMADEGDETFDVVLSAPVEATLADSTGTGTILADENPPAISVADATTSEGDAGTSTMSIDISLSNPGSAVVTVDWATSNGTATSGSDYTGASGTVAFAPGETFKTVNIVVNGDSTYEQDETFAVTLSNASGGTIADASAVGTIDDDDTLPTLAIDDVSVAEGDAGSVAATFTVTLAGATGLTTSVDWTTAAGTASAGSDYAAGSGSLTFTPGQTSKTVTVNIVGDTTIEPNETFGVDLSNVSGATLSDSHGAGVIQNDDKLTTALTLGIKKSTRTVSAKGTLAGGISAGASVEVKLQKKKGASYVDVGTKTVNVKNISAGTGSFLARFRKPRAGSYRFVTTYAGDVTHLSCSKTKAFRI